VLQYELLTANVTLQADSPYGLYVNVTICRAGRLTMLYEVTRVNGEGKVIPLL
jgi:hypothetical protein